MSTAISPTTAESINRASLIKAILTTWLVAGTLDMTGAIVVWSFILQKVTPLQILQGIASGIFGKAAFTGGSAIAVYGVFFHYIIAFSFTTLYFLVYPQIPFLQKQKLISGLLYGVFAWAFMNYIVLPLSNVHMNPFKWSNALISIAILMVCIGLPISLLSSRYYKNRRVGN